MLLMVASLTNIDFDRVDFHDGRCTACYCPDLRPDPRNRSHGAAGSSFSVQREAASGGHS